MLLKDIFKKYFIFFFKKKYEEKTETMSEFSTSLMEGFRLKYNYKEIVNNFNLNYVFEIKKNSELNEIERSSIVKFLKQEDNKNIFIWEHNLEIEENGYSLFFIQNNEVIAYIQVIEDSNDLGMININYLSVKKALRLQGVATHLLAQTIAFCDRTYPTKDIAAWIDIEISDFFSDFGFNPFIGQIEEVNGRQISLFTFRWEFRE
ncbi:GNAT family N-acetyltransferase [Actinobacillus porcinus]|uniref:GNAT family N-acetyltransferase n=1 Tax=Actinobacillus porcinus TaxID=51048 RepID=UPI00235473DE|nr:GNAT family N-acetyltransferase [Actinobacillus porcinus]MCI7719329.1 GNAT family N-acetyltransferase [[Pasteurella] aerogenes]